MVKVFEMVEDLYVVTVCDIEVNEYEELFCTVDSVKVQDPRGFSFYLTEEQLVEWEGRYCEDLNELIWDLVLEVRREKGL